MYAYIKGKLAHCGPTSAIVEAAGLGYDIHINTQTYASIKEKIDVKLYLHYHKSEHSDTLYGFYTQDERDLFISLISVNKIGPSTAQIMLSTYLVGELKQAIANGDIASLCKIKGIGNKTAQRVILDLRDRFIKENSLDVGGIGSTNPKNRIMDEVSSALLSLGFHQGEIHKTIQHIQTNSSLEEDLEAYLKEALKILAG